MLAIAVENLLAERKIVKKLLKDERDEDMRTILDLRQKAIKVAANAFFEQSTQAIPTIM